MSSSQRSVRVRTIVRRVRESIWLSLMAITLLIFGVGLALLLLTTTIGSSPGVSGRPRRRGLRCVPSNRDPRPPTIGAAWMRAAENEAASVAAFEALATRLTSLGAPDELVRRSHSAAADERRHAVNCRAIARGFDADVCVVAPDADVAAEADVTAPQVAGLARSIGILQVAIESQLDGTYDEGFSAALLQQGASAARGDDLAARLRSIAADEQRHAELASDIVEWCATEVGMPARLAVRCSRARRWLPKRLPPTADVPDEEMVAAGLVPKATARALWHAHCAADRGLTPT